MSASIPPEPVADTGSVAWFSVRNVARRRSAVSSINSTKNGSRCPTVGCASASRTRCGTGLGPEPSRSRGGGAKLTAPILCLYHSGSVPQPFDVGPDVVLPSAFTSETPANRRIAVARMPARSLPR